MGVGVDFQRMVRLEFGVAQCTLEFLFGGVHKGHVMIEGASIFEQLIALAAFVLQQVTNHRATGQVHLVQVTPQPKRVFKRRPFALRAVEVELLLVVMIALKMRRQFKVGREFQTTLAASRPRVRRMELRVHLQDGVVAALFTALWATESQDFRRQMSLQVQIQRLFVAECGRAQFAAQTTRIGHFAFSTTGAVGGVRTFLQMTLQQVQLEGHRILECRLDALRTAKHGRRTGRIGLMAEL
jgi:hypothetical protein